jgi:predicted metalloprotease with PDZ domain
MKGRLPPFSANRFSDRAFLAALMLAVLSAGTGFMAQKAGSQPRVSITLKPSPIDKDNHVGYVDVMIAFPVADAPAGVPLLSLPIVVANIETVAKTMTNFEATDANGVLPMKVEDNASDDPMPIRRWIPARPVKRELVVRYRAPIASTPPTRSGPPFGLQSEAGGFSGAGYAFILTPVESKPYVLAIRWDLAALGPGSGGSSSFGDGDVEIAEAPIADQLTSAFFMAGPLHRYPKKPTAGGFSSVWLGSPPFDPLPLMAWTEKLHTWYRAFFKAESVKPYRVFLRYNPVNPNGGAGLHNSFVATFDQNTKAKDLELLLAHEMLHTFAPSLDEIGDRPTSTQWFSEGLAIYYQRLLPLRAGLIAAADFLEDLNQTAGRYYTNGLNTTPNDQIAARFWEDTRIRVLPYDRGSMYLAVVSAQIRKASGGQRSLDDLVLALLERQRQGMSNSPEVWVELITKELGLAAKADYESMLAGAVMLPETNAFGPCFERRTARLRRFELGFDPKVMNQSPRLIRGLIPGSEAERAGLRDGDEITQPVGLDSIQEDQKRTLTLRIRREGKVFPVTYLPRGEIIDAYQWARVPGIPDRDCRQWDGPKS